jgi:hypothetical protein
VIATAKRRSCRCDFRDELADLKGRDEEACSGSPRPGHNGLDAGRLPLAHSKSNPADQHFAELIQARDSDIGLPDNGREVRAFHVLARSDLGA